MNSGKENNILTDLSGFKAFYEEFFAALAVFAKRYVSDVDLAKDIAQEAFVTAWKKKTDIKDAEHLRLYLYTVTRNKCINHLKHEDVKQAHQEAIIQEIDQHYFDNTMIEQEVFLQLKKAIAELAPQTQKIINLSLQGYGNIEISETIGSSVNTIKALKRRAFQKLRAELQEHFYMFFL